MKRNREAGFTLVELLVVIGIIALLISILLPALGRARWRRQTVACLANLRTCGQAMQMFASENKGALLGAGVNAKNLMNAAGTASDPTKFSPNLPQGGPIALADWCGPMAEMLKIAVSSSKMSKDRYARYRQIGIFLCPSNQGVVSTSFVPDVDANAGPGPQLGYATAFSFLLLTGSPTPGITSHTRISTGAGWWIFPSGYYPKITKIGKTSEKIYMADAGKFVNGAAGPDYNLYVDPNPNAGGRNSGPYTDHGAFTNATAAYDRTNANGGTGIDGRVFAFRHGKRQQNLKFGSYRLNALFFDGHASTLDEAEAIDPRKWLPSKTVIPDNSKIWADVISTHNMTFPYRIP